MAFEALFFRRQLGKLAVATDAAIDVFNAAVHWLRLVADNLVFDNKLATDHFDEQEAIHHFPQTMQCFVAEHVFLNQGAVGFKGQQ